MAKTPTHSDPESLEYIEADEINACPQGLEPLPLRILEPTHRMMYALIAYERSS